MFFSYVGSSSQQSLGFDGNSSWERGCSATNHWVLRHSASPRWSSHHLWNVMVMTNMMTFCNHLGATNHSSFASQKWRNKQFLEERTREVHVFKNSRWCSSFINVIWWLSLMICQKHIVFNGIHQQQSGLYKRNYKRISPIFCIFNEMGTWSDSRPKWVRKMQLINCMSTNFRPCRSECTKLFCLVWRPAVRNSKGAFHF